MVYDEECGLKVAEFLLKIKAVKLQPDEPFTWASGWKSPIYCDNRKTLSYPEIRTYLRQRFVDLILDTYGKPDVIAGVATGGIAIGALVAQELGLPFVYVRASSKSHGLNNQIEGDLREGQSVVVIEDLVSSGKSSLVAVDALREAGAVVKGMAAIFTYGFEVATENFKSYNCKLMTLSDYALLLQEAVDSDYITEDKLDTLKEWRTSPNSWKN
ncbi:MAG: orotate phosphoribosyltransferase [Flavobacteriales bacterium]|nr:orotate phosphoribosyltransferase [Flavobacteriales bacterium]MCB9195753.1 orotate phosphoribosyltransferase [Flavobacteriales bacterium]MCB9198807.1 orotate phosphoribosyltransferase [Flavobacteriales bacterium]